MNRFARAAALLSLVILCSVARPCAADSPDELRQRAKELHQKAAALAENGQSEAAAKYEQEAHKLMEAAEHAGNEQSPGTPDEMKQLAVGAERLKHLRVAVENLRAAGMNDVADELTKQAEKMERDLRQFKQALAARSSQSQGNGPGDSREIRAAIEDLHREVEQLRSEVKELRARVNKS